MGKKTKVGKGRLDKYYHLAKDQGYRSRACFKLIQLAKKNDFLSQARVCIDLCAAPGGWAQVAQRNMPAGSQIIAIDLAPIKPIHGVTCIQSDITTEKCRNLLKKELKGANADIVLHDGAPNVGTSWAQDAYVQNELTLHSLKLACEHLTPGGTFVTKVFRSADYNSLMWVFGQLFKKVDATKPTASRNVSAEIFVVCSGFKAGKLDPKFFQPQYVFMETLDPIAVAAAQAKDQNKKQGASLADFLKSSAKKHRGGYEDGDLHKVIPAHEFVDSTNPAEILVTHHKINLEAPGSEHLDGHFLTDEDIREACTDLKVCGKKDLGNLLKWRMKIRREREKLNRATKKAEGKDAAKEEEEEAPSKEKDKKKNKDKDEVPKVTAKGALEKDVDEAIDELLDDDGGAKVEKPPADAEGEDGDADADNDEDEEDGEDEEIERDLAEMVEKRRKEDKREMKKTMERQKKQEWRRKMSLGVSKHSQDQPELFKASRRSVKALEDQDRYLDAAKLDSDAEDSGAEGDRDDESESDSDEGLDRYARMEVDLAVDHQLRQMRAEDKYRTQQQRVRKIKKETRRQRVTAAWAGEMKEFHQSLENQVAEQHALKNKDSDEEDDDDDDDEDADLHALRDLQRPAGTGSGGIDGEALEALADGPNPKRKRAQGKKDGEGDEGEGDEEDAMVPAEDNEEALRADHRANRWFSQDIFKSVGGDDGGAIIPLDRDSESDSDDDEGGQIREVDDKDLPKLPLTDKQIRSLKRKKDLERKEGKDGKRRKKGDEEEDNRPMEVAPLEAPKPLVVNGKVAKPTDPHELAETMALGSLMVESKKSRMELIDAAYNRWTFEGDDGLPDWFTEEEDKFSKPELPITKELMEQFRQKLREINARPIRKVVEAKARKQKRLKKRLEKLRSTAMTLMDTPDMSQGAKARQMRKAMAKAAKADERKVSVVSIKKGGGGKTDKGKVPRGAKVKVVDKRLKSDKRGLKLAAKRNKKKAQATSRKASIKKEKNNGKRKGGGSASKSKKGGKA
mmetsp:Transcript_60321/g.155411  ORF Transcript_60321/g.155411 Transcript_60321/m.155411 type:complete len:1020 (-) Transcript_60321:45-3104(-)|eukprot:CAMPEP_0195114988 /NCGR_PEP_ID=MMETSP0448-20130528/107626_1 /TAXON_ID=66468 /ORGANISM="Heterocapsa triquestra, Strain CCMP 448" /LENGTH=1019 /DNA_ID=CAMNT_0040152063 /DNA_START=55 /DNA_END=3114 /DNA_ORIENTATION=+